MENKVYDSLKDLRIGKYDRKVQARIMNLWRGYTKKGEPFKSFNLLLLDNKRSRIHAFVPGNVADVMEPALEIGKIYLFENFTVKEYREEDKFRCIMKEIQIIFSSETKVSDLDESEVCIDRAGFDFYDIADLKELTKQTTYLTDVIGVILDAEINLAKFNNKRGEPQTNIKFTISDGKSKVKVNFWDGLAELFNESINEDFQWPLIIIIASGRVTEWHEEVDVSNVGASTFYLNYDHYSVNHLRTMLKGPDFKEYPKSMVHFEPLQVLTIKQIKELGEDYIEKKVLCNVKVKKVQWQEKWFKYICTSCYKETNWLEQTHSRICVPREVPYPLKWFNLCILCFDGSGQIEIVLENVAGQKCYGKHVSDMLEQEDDNQFPKHLETIVDEHYRFQIQIQRGQNSKDPYIYVAKDMIKQYPSEVNSIDTDSNQPRPLEESYGEPSASTFHIDTMSENN